ncbi:hypothetical protein [Actinokineospora sp. HUAS TT18]|uniref:hypothetical protein n=1 Tax=Actinokineospora sp. HUAS TT18 TaxID=3447451 RepID=UPI003F51F63E
MGGLLVGQVPVTELAAVVGLVLVAAEGPVSRLVGRGLGERAGSVAAARVACVGLLGSRGVLVCGGGVVLPRVVPGGLVVAGR